MAHKIRKFSKGGAQGKYDRRMADIEKDFKKDSVGKTGKAFEVLAAKRAQRIADAEDDRAKRIGADRTATRKGEADAEAALTQARRTRGQSIADRDTAAAKATTAPAATAPAAAPAAKPDYDKMSFAKAFAAARGVEGKPNFTWKGKSYNTNLASSKPATPARAATRPRAATPAANGRPGDVPKSNLEEIRAQGTALRDSFTGLPGGDQRMAYATRIQDLEQKIGKARVAGQRPLDQDIVGLRRMKEEFNKLKTTTGMKKGGTIKKKPAAKKPVMKYAKGGSIDGCAIRGKTRAPRTR